MLERGGQELAGIEVKAAAKVTGADVRIDDTFTHSFA